MPWLSIFFGSPRFLGITENVSKAAKNLKPKALISKNHLKYCSGKVCTDFNIAFDRSLGGHHLYMINKHKSCIAA